MCTIQFAGCQKFPEIFAARLRDLAEKRAKLIAEVKAHFEKK